MTMNTATLSTIEINGVTYVPAGAGGVNTLPSGNRNVVVIDRGFIYAGDLSFDEATQDYTLANAVWVFGWESIGLDGVIREPKSNKVTLKKMDNLVIVPRGSVIFRIPVSANWGL